MLLSFMFSIGVPVTASNFNNLTLLDLATNSAQHMWILPDLYRVIENHDPKFCHPEIAHSRLIRLWSFQQEEELLEQMNVWCNNIEVAEGKGLAFWLCNTKD